MPAPRVSVVIDNYNYGRFLGQAVQSVLEQDCGETVECVVVDDGSTDESREVLASFGERVRAILQDNRGQARAFNAGFAAARGEFVCLLDSDDYWAPDKLSKVLARFRDPEVGVVQHYLRDLDGSGRPLPQHLPRWPESYSLDDFLDYRIELTATSGLSFRRSVFDRITPLPPDIFFHLDDLLVAKALCLSRVANIREPLGVHRVHGGNFCALGLQDARKIELDLKMREVFARELDSWFARHGRAVTPRYRALEGLERARSRVLLAAHRGRRAEALREWRAMLLGKGAMRHRLFKSLTCVFALFSPRLYLALYGWYGRSCLSRLRAGPPS